MKQVKQQFPYGILVISSIILSSAPHAHLSDHFKFPPHYWILTDSISHAAQILQHLPTTPGGETQALALGWDSATSFDPPTDPQSWSDGYIHFSCINPPITQQTEQHIWETPDLGSYNCVHLLRPSLFVLKTFAMNIEQLLHFPGLYCFILFVLTYTTSQCNYPTI